MNGRRSVAAALAILAIVAPAVVSCVALPAAPPVDHDGAPSRDTERVASPVVALPTMPTGGDHIVVLGTPMVASSGAPTGAPMDFFSGEPAGVLEVRRVPVGPRLDAGIDPLWATARLLRIPMPAGREDSAAPAAFDVELRAMRTDDRLYFLAQWPGDPPTDSANASAANPGAADGGTAGAESSSNLLTIHWTIPAPEGVQPPACAVGCHTAFVDGEGRVAYFNAQTIPQGGAESLPAAGGWEAGRWSVAWSRPLVSPNLYDLQLTDLAASYPFFIKVFLGAGDRPDPVSQTYTLRFAGAR